MRISVFIAGLSAFAVFPGADKTHAQLPDEFTNLEVLPEDIPQRELVGIMREMTRSLGVRCTYCHVGEEGEPLSTYDFASDDKEHKRKARLMMRMVQTINGELLADLENRHEPGVEVTCATCHRGLSTPRMIHDILVEAYDEGGVDEVVRRYEELRERYYGSYSYDFTERRLNDVANTISDRSLDDARAILHLNRGFFPESPNIYYMLGEVDLAQDRRDAAIANFQRTLQLNPDYVPAQRRLQQLGVN